MREFFFLFISCSHFCASIVNIPVAMLNRVRRSVATPDSACHFVVTSRGTTVATTSLANIATTSVVVWSRRSGPVLINPVHTLQAHASIHRFFINGFVNRSRSTVDFVTLRMLHSSLPQCALSFGAYMLFGWMHTLRASHLYASMRLYRSW